MRRLSVTLVALLVLGGCAAGTATPPAASPGGGEAPSPAVTASGSAIPAPSATIRRREYINDLTPVLPPIGVYSGRVTFDGRRCVYAGPTVIPAPATLRLEYAPTPDQAGSAALFTPVRAETTQADLDRVNADPKYGTGPGQAIPDFMIYTMMGGIVGAGVQDVPLEIRRLGRVYDKVAVYCVTYPAMPNETSFGPGAILQLVEP